jgi:hypothetical protein
MAAHLDAAIAKALAEPEVRDTFAKQGVGIVHMNPNQSARLCKRKPRGSAASSRTPTSAAQHRK